MVNLVTIDETKYLVDVGYGRREPTQPVPLTAQGYEFAGIAPTRGKLERKTLSRHQHQHNATAGAGAARGGQSLWVYSAWTTGPEDDDGSTSTGPGWVEQYSFTEVEFFPEDFEVMNLYVMTTPQSYFVQTVLAYRAIWDEEAAELVGEVILHKDSLKRIHRGRSEAIAELRSEGDRVGALEEYFFISLTEKEKKAIQGLASALKS